MKATSAYASTLSSYGTLIIAAIIYWIVDAARIMRAHRGTPCEHRPERP